MNKLIRNLSNNSSYNYRIVVAAGPFYVLNEGEQAVVTRFGAIVSSNTEAGLKFKMPFVDNVVKYPEETSFMGRRCTENTYCRKPVYLGRCYSKMERLSIRLNSTNQ